MKDRPTNHFLAYRITRQWVVASLFGAKAFKKASKVNKVRPKMLQLSAKITDFIAILAVPDVPKLCWEYSFSIVLVHFAHIQQHRKWKP